MAVEVCETWTGFSVKPERGKTRFHENLCHVQTTPFRLVALTGAFLVTGHLETNDLNMKSLVERERERERERKRKRERHKDTHIDTS